MTITEFLSEHLERELLVSHRVLANVPERKSDWRPHERSMQLGYLATLVATMPSWIAMTIEKPELDIRPKEGQGIRPEPWKKNAELLSQFEQASGAARAALRATSDDQLATPWRMLAGGKVVDERPRREVIADTLCHAAHHRGQLSVYLRLLEIPVPSIYGPSADDRVF
jgi:uncharacterized damage-inducible protein DinB